MQIISFCLSQININEINKSFFKSHSVDLLLFLNSVRNKLLNNTFISIDNHPTAFIDDNIFNIEESVIRVAFSVKKIDVVDHFFQSKKMAVLGTKTIWIRLQLSGHINQSCLHQFVGSKNQSFCES